MPPVVVAGRNLDRQVGDAQLGVDGHLRPDAGVAGVLPGAILPGVVTELARLRNGVEDPEPLTAAGVEAAHVALGGGAARRRAPGAASGADDHDVAGHHRRAVPGQLARDRVEVLVVVLLEIDDAVGAEVPDRPAGGGVERDELIADGHEVDPFIACAVRPVPDAAARQSPHRPLGPFPLVEAIHPQVLARRGVERDDGAAAAGGGVEHAVDDERGRLQVEVGARPEVVGPEAPRDLQVAEVAGVDLIERCVARRAEVARPGAPLAAGRAVLRRRRRAAEQGCCREQQERRAEPERRSDPER